MKELEEKEEIIKEEDILNYVNNAIVDVLAGGQTVQIGGRKIERANLDDIKELRDKLMNEINNNNNNELFSNTYVGTFSRR